MKYPDQVAYGAYGSHALVSGNAYDLFVACETDADWIDEILDDCLRKADMRETEIAYYGYWSE